MLGDHLRNTRRASGIAQKTLAEMAKVSVRTVSEVESGNGNSESFKRLCHALSITWIGLPRGADIISAIEVLRHRKQWTRDRICREASISPPAYDRLISGSTVHMATLDSVIDVLAPNTRPRLPQRAEWANGDRDCRFTPLQVYMPLIEIFGEIDLDPCGDERAPIPVRHRYTISDDGLSHPWSGDVVFVNPPFSASATWTGKCYQEWKSGRAKTVIGLFPVRTHTVAFHEQVFGAADVLLLRNRIRFLDSEGERRNVAPFSCMLVVWGADLAAVEELSFKLPGALIRREIACD